MKHLAAYLLLKLGGNANPTKEDITKSLATVGVEVDENRLDRLLTDLEGKDLKEIMTQGKAMLATFGGGGGGGGGAAAGAGAAEAAVEEPREEEKEEEMEAPAVDMFGSGGGGGDY